MSIYMSIYCVYVLNDGRRRKIYSMGRISMKGSFSLWDENWMKRKKEWRLLSMFSFLPPILHHWKLKCEKRKRRMGKKEEKEKRKMKSLTRKMGLNTVESLEWMMERERGREMEKEEERSWRWKLKSTTGENVHFYRILIRGKKRSLSLSPLQTIPWEEGNKKDGWKRRTDRMIEIEGEERKSWETGRMTLKWKRGEWGKENEGNLIRNWIPFSFKYSLL